jgi:HD-GYP domain-containing protein (c-di-GMP phosphodiesterase class II)
MNTRTRLYIAAIVAAATLAALGLYLVSPDLSANYIKAVVCLGAVALLTQLLGFLMLRTTVTGTISFVPFLANAAVAPNWLTVVGVFVVVSVVQITRDIHIAKKVFNVAQQCLAMSVAILVYRMVGGYSLLLIPTIPYLQLLLLFLSFFIVNVTCVSGVIAITEEKPFMEVWSAITMDLPHDLLSWPIIICLAWIYTKYGIPGAFALTVPLLGLRQLYKINWQLEKTNQELLELMVAAIEARDPYTSGHSRRVSQNAKIIAQILGLKQSKVKRIEIAALLHDVGKIHEVFAPILQKPGRLTDEEHAIMQTHPVKSEELVAKVSQLRDIVSPVRHHHENWDGTGYPDRIAGERIPLASRIIMFADTIDAMTSDRPYRKALDESAVRQELIKHRARQFDPTICDALLSSKRFVELFSHAAHQSLPHTQEIPKLRLAVHS